MTVSGMRDGDRDKDPADASADNNSADNGIADSNETGGEDENWLPTDVDGDGDIDEDDVLPSGVEWRKGPVLPSSLDDAGAAVAGAGAAVAGAGAAAASAFNDESEQLALGDDDVKLPWLEAGDDDDRDFDSGGSSQMLGFIVLGLLALGLIVGAIWWATRRSADEDLIADGSTIAAPETPYKEKPADPGGKKFDGTGDTSFAVSDGQSRPARLGESGTAPGPGFTTVAPGAGNAAASAGKPGAAAAAGAGAAVNAAGSAAGASSASATDTAGVGVQVGAYSTRATAETGWSKLSGQHSLLSGLRHRVIEGKADIGTVYRLQAVAADAASARTLCGQLRSAGVACQVKN